MNTLKIMLLLKRKFSEYYDIRHYKEQPAEQVIVKKYAANSQEVIIDENE